MALNDKSDFVGGKEKEKYIIATDLLALYNVHSKLPRHIKDRIPMKYDRAEKTFILLALSS